MTNPAKRAARLAHRIYRRLFAEFGPQHWWPAENVHELIIGVVLTQNTSWSNVEKALAQLKAAGVRTLAGVAALPQAELAGYIQSAGYFNVKAARLKSVASYFVHQRRENFTALRRRALPALRAELLAVNGIGPESVDSILLYGLGHPAFVIDAYTLRIGARHGLFPPDTKYESARQFFEQSYSANSHAGLSRKARVQLFNEYHALLVRIGHHYCKPRPQCAQCPLNRRELFGDPAQAPPGSAGAVNSEQ